MNDIETVNMKRKGVTIIDGTVYVEKMPVDSLRAEVDPEPSPLWDDPVYALVYKPMKGVCQVFKGLNDCELIERILDLAKREPKKPYVVYSLIAKVYGKKGVLVADYFETPDYLRALEAFDRMLTQGKLNQYDFAGMCEVILTKTQYDSDGKAVLSKQFKARVNEEEALR